MRNVSTSRKSIRQILFQKLSIRYWTWPMCGLSRSSNSDCSSARGKNSGSDLLACGCTSSHRYRLMLRLESRCPQRGRVPKFPSLCSDDFQLPGRAVFAEVRRFLRYLRKERGFVLRIEYFLYSYEKFEHWKGFRLCRPDSYRKYFLSTNPDLGS